MLDDNTNDAAIESDDTESAPVPLTQPSPQRKTHRPGYTPKNKLPSSFTSSFKIHEIMMGDGNDMPASITDAFSRWALCFLVIQFDVDIGPDLKIIRPSLQFDEADFRTICFSALPERSGSTKKTTTHFHTFRWSSQTHGKRETYGYCLFTQQQNPTLPRGYLQESIVIISQHNFPKLFEKCLESIMDHDRFLTCSLDQKIPLLDNAIYNIAEWPHPEPSVNLEVGFLGAVYNVVVPKNDYTPLVGYNKTKPNELSASEPIGSWNGLVEYFSDLSELYMLYELTLLGKPTIIYSTSPRVCSRLISNLVDLIRPVPYSHRIREYVTIYSAPEDLEEGLTGITNPMLVGPSTNAYVCLLTKSAVYSRAGRWASRLLRGGSGGAGAGNGTDSFEEDDAYKEEMDRLRISVKASNKQIIQQRCLNPDQRFLSQLQQLVSGSPQNPIIDHTIRFHFATLTSKLVSPLSVYFIPSPSKETGLIFNQLDFVNDLSNDETWNEEPVESAKAAADAEPLVKLSTLNVWHTLQKMSSKASLLSPQNMGIKFVNNNSVVSKQEFYHQVIASKNFKAWLKSNGVDPEL